MTNKELLEIVELAQIYHVSGKTLKRVLKIMENDGKIESSQAYHIEMLIKTGPLQDEEIVSLLEKAYQTGSTSWLSIALLKHFPILKAYLKGKDFNHKVWNIIFEFIRIMPFDPKFENFYVQELKLRENTLSIQEFAFFHKIFEKSMNTSLIYKSWYLPYFLDQKKTRRNRNALLDILKNHLFDLQLNGKEEEEKAKKIIKCFDLYGEHLTDIYATIINDVDIDVPQITGEIERDIYIELFTYMCCLDTKENVMHNFLTSFYYQLATNKSIDANERLEFVRNLSDETIILKDRIVEILWNTYLNQGIDAMGIVKYAFLNNGIRTKKSCKKFLEQEESIEVLELAREVFRKNRVRQDEESLKILCNLKTAKEKIEFLHFLDNKYPDVTPEELEYQKQKEEKLLRDYNKFLSTQMGLDKLRESLESSLELEVDLRRIRRKNNGV